MSFNAAVLKFKAFGLCDKGSTRPNNEDACYLSDAHQLYAVADGLGGLPDGDLASSLAIETLGKALHTVAPGAALDLDALTQSMHTAIYHKGLTLDSHTGMATTLTLVHIQAGMLHLRHAGDSGVYLLRGPKLTQLTHDHTLAQEILDKVPAGQARPSIPEYYHHTLTRCLGQIDALVFDSLAYPLHPKDRILLYTDGLTKVVQPSEIQAHLAEAVTPEACVVSLIQLVHERGSPDNTTLIALYL